MSSRHNPGSRPRATVRAALCALLAPLLTIVSPSPAGAVGPPVIAHAPVASGVVYQPVAIAATTTCGASELCTMSLSYRTTGGGAVPPGAWQRAELHQVSTTALAGGQSAREWQGAIPGPAMDSTGVDYFLEATGSEGTNRLPLVDVGTPGSYFHVAALAPPAITHLPVPYAVDGQDIPIEARATCSTPSCTATVFYRTSPAQSDSADLATSELAWASTRMRVAGTQQLGDIGRQLTYVASIPKSVVDPRGVDYVIQVKDDSTTSYSPGTSHIGYVPIDGIRVKHYHIHILEPTRIAHIPVATGAFRTSVAIQATATCSVARTCTARLYYRTTDPNRTPTSDDFSGDNATSFTSTSMAVTPGGINKNGLRTINVVGSVPANVVGHARN